MSTSPPRRFPIQAIGQTRSPEALRSIPWDLAAEAWAYYDKLYPGSTMEAMAARAGFDMKELDCLFNQCPDAGKPSHSHGDLERQVLRTEWISRAIQPADGGFCAITPRRRRTLDAERTAPAPVPGVVGRTDGAN